jgi:hypothetical protein
LVTASDMGAGCDSALDIKGIWYQVEASRNFPCADVLLQMSRAAGRKEGRDQS